MFEKPMVENKGQVFPAQIKDDNEWKFYIDVLEKLDLPPDVCAVLITPSTRDGTPIAKLSEEHKVSPSASERNAYMLLITHYLHRSVIIQVSLPGLASIGIDCL